MSVTAIYEKVESGSAEVDRLFQKTYSRSFAVVSDSPKLRPGTAITAVVSAFACGVGTHYKVLDPDDLTGSTVLEEDTASFVQKIAASLASVADDGCQWDVTVSYGTGEGTLTEEYTDAFPSDPLDHRLKVSWGSSRFSKAVQEDKDGNPILNSADDFPEKTPEVDDSRIVLKIVRNQATFSPTLAQTYKNTVNGAAWTVCGEAFAARTVKCLDITGDLNFHPEAGFYFPVNYEFEVNPATWAATFLDEGFRAMDPSTHKKTDFVDESGKPLSTPQLLDGSGAKLAHGGTPVVLSFDVYPESNFDDFAFDFSSVPGY